MPYVICVFFFELFRIFEFKIKTFLIKLNNLTKKFFSSLCQLEWFHVKIPYATSLNFPPKASRFLSERGHIEVFHNALNGDIVLENRASDACT